MSQRITDSTCHYSIAEKGLIVRPRYCSESGAYGESLGLNKRLTPRFKMYYAPAPDSILLALP